MCDLYWVVFVCWFVVVYLVFVVFVVAVVFCGVISRKWKLILIAIHYFCTGMQKMLLENETATITTVTDCA